MTLSLLGLALLAVFGAWWWLRPTPPARPARPARPATPMAAPRAAAPQPGPAAAPAAPAARAPTATAEPPLQPGHASLPAAPTGEAPTPLPPAVGLALHPAELLDEHIAAPLMAAMRELPRPPRSFHELMSPGFIQNATSVELANLVLGEPAVAARVIATANSPMYGLQQPVASIGQATTFLGLASVRQMCLQHMMAACFQPRDEAQRREFDVLWRASSIAGELCQQLAMRLRTPEPNRLATLLVLSFLGRQAGAALLPDAGVLPGMDAFERALHEQQELGLASHELGRLLMRAWELPADLADEARALSALRFDPDRVLPPDREASLTLGAVCALLGERIARGQVGATLYDPANDPCPDMAALRHRLARPPLDQIDQELRSPALLRVLARVMPNA